MPARPDPIPTDALVGRLRATLADRGGDPAEVLVHDEHLPAREPVGAVLRPQLPRPLGDALRRRGITRLYSHQVAAIDLARAGKDVVVTTPTASGKTFCFNLPVVERALLNPTSRALYLYPTKALAADQLRGLQSLLGDISGGPALSAARLDGDVSPADRDGLRADPPHVLLANPDIVHHDILLRNRRWQRLLGNLSFIVLDELHSYRGVFGAHVGLILRRLLRLAAAAGSRPVVIAASATIANPDELAERLTGRKFAVVAGDGAGQNARRFLFWRPSRRGAAERNQHQSSLAESVAVFDELLLAGRTAILFGQSRVAVERMLALAKRDLPPGIAARVSAYKSGYTPEERARIEAQLREGELRGVIATNALELGIDVGALDAAVLAGYPGSVMSAWQQAGRVGRRDGDEALIVLVGADDALDQYYLTHPRAFFDQSSEQAVVDLANEGVMLGHLLCAAQEAPLGPADLAFFPAGAKRAVDRLVSEGLLTPRAPHCLPADAELPHRQIGIRGVRRDQYHIVEGAREIAQIEPPHLYREAHPGALYLHQGQSYRVLAIDETAKVVRVQREPGEGRTDPKARVVVSERGPAFRDRAIRVGPAKVGVSIGAVVANESIAEYRETWPGARRPILHDVSPALQFTLETVGVWLDFPRALGATAGALHAAEHALVNALPIALLCDRRDVGSSSDAGVGEGGRVYLFDAYEGGIGLAEKAYQLADRLIQAAVELLAGCQCEAGCPSCVHLAGCSSGNDELDKAGALALLRGQAVAPEREVARRREATPSSAADSGTLARLRRLAESSLRERLAIGPGDVLHYGGYGPVTVIEVSGDRARVQFRESAARMWVPIRELKRR